MLSYKDYLLVWFKCCVNDLYAKEYDNTIPYSSASPFLAKYKLISEDIITNPEFMQDFLSLINPKEFPSFDSVCDSFLDRINCILMQLRGFFKRHGFIAASYFSYLKKYANEYDARWKILELIFLVGFLNKTTCHTKLSKFIGEFFQNLFYFDDIDSILFQVTIWMLNNGFNKLKGNVNENRQKLKGFEELSNFIAKVFTINGTKFLLDDKALLVINSIVDIFIPKKKEKLKTSRIINSESNSLVVSKNQSKENNKLKEKIKEYEKIINDYTNSNRKVKSCLTKYNDLKENYERSLNMIRELKEELINKKKMEYELEINIDENSDLKEIVKFYKNENNRLRLSTKESIETEINSTRSCESFSSDLQSQLVEKLFLTTTKEVASQTDKNLLVKRSIKKNLERLVMHQELQKNTMKIIIKSIDNLKWKCCKNKKSLDEILGKKKKSKGRKWSLISIGFIWGLILCLIFSFVFYLNHA